MPVTNGTQTRIPRSVFLSSVARIRWVWNNFDARMQLYDILLHDPEPRTQAQPTRADMMSTYTSSASTTNTTMRRIRLVVGVLASALFTSAGCLKLMNFQPFVVYYAKWGQPHWVLLSSGVVEVLAGIALLVPRLRVHAAWTLLSAIFLVCWHPWTISDPSFVVAQSASIIMLLLLVWLPLGNQR